MTLKRGTKVSITFLHDLLIRTFSPVHPASTSYNGSACQSALPLPGSPSRISFNGLREPLFHDTHDLPVSKSLRQIALEPIRLFMDIGTFSTSTDGIPTVGEMMDKLLRRSGTEYG
jgi:hypothetical protein